MDETPIAESNQPAGTAERESDLAILEALEVELAEVEAALERLDARVDSSGDRDPQPD